MHYRISQHSCWIDSIYWMTQSKDGKNRKGSFTRVIIVVQILNLPVILHKSLNVGASPEYWLIMPLLAACGTGIVNVIGLWNLRLLGSTVTMGDTATLLPRSLAASSVDIGWAYNKTIHFSYRNN